MILEYLQPDPNIWDGLTVVARFGYHTAALGAAGLALFGLGFGHRLMPEELDALRRWIAGAVILGLGATAAAFVLRVVVLTAGEPFDPVVWQTVLRARLGDAGFLRVVGLLLIASLVARWRVAPVLAGAGILLVAAAHAAMGHSTLYRPRQELAILFTIHVTTVAFWVGSLLPLSWVADRGDREAAQLVHDWSKAAMIAVAVMIGTGLWLALLLVGRPEHLITSWYGNTLLAKLGLVGLVLMLAAINKLLLSRDLALGLPDAPGRLVVSIRLEMVLMLVILYAAAELTSVHPIDVGHRLPS